jgi:tetratricopeptide (TPR) repeat protein
VDFEYLSESLAEDVISQLFNLSSYTVISSRSSFQFKNSDRSLSQISKELKADILLIGNFKVNHDEIELKIEVVKGKDNEILNYATIGANFDDIKSVSKQIGQALYQTLDITSEKPDQPRMRDTEVINIEAYKLNALGKSAMYDHTGQKREDIIQYFQAAIDIDSTYVDPYLGIAEAYIFDVNRGYISPVEAAQKARKFALIAEKLRPGCGEVSSLMGIIHYLNSEYEKAAPYFERSLEVSPNYYMTYHYYSFSLVTIGKFEKAMELQKKASIIDPLNGFNDIYIAVNYMFQDKLNEAHSVVDRLLILDPDHAMSLWMKAILLNQEQKYEEALHVVEKRALGLESNFIAGYTYAMVGQREKAELVLHNIIENSKRTFVPPAQIAIVYCGLNEKEKAIEQVEEAVLVHDVWVGYLKYGRLADPIKHDPRFVSLMNKLTSE